MPYKPKIVTRGISTSTVSADSIPKNAALTNNELDSNFLNIRDGSIGIVGDDSTGIDVRFGDTIKLTGAGGATVTAVGDTITITAGGGGGGGGGSIGDLSISGTTISGPSNSNISIIPSGTGSVVLDGITITNFTISSGGALFVLDAGSSNIKMTDFLDMDANRIVGVGTPIDIGDAANKVYVDNQRLTYGVQNFSPGQTSTALYRSSSGAFTGNGFFRLNMGANGTISALNNFSTGQTLVLLVVQDATGGRTLTFTPTLHWEGGSFPGLSTGPNKRDIITIFHSGEADSDAYHASIRKDFA